MISAQIIPLFFTLGFGGLITGAFYFVINLIREYFGRRLICSVVIDSMDPTHKWVLQYLTEKGFLADKMSEMIVKVKKPKRNWWFEAKKKEKMKVEYYPAPGTHYFTFQGKKFWAQQDEGKTQTVGWNNKPETHSKIVIMTYGGDVKLIRELVDEAVIYSMDQDKGLLGIYQVMWSDFWLKVQTKKARTLDSVVLDTDIASTLSKDIKDF